MSRWMAFGTAGFMVLLFSVAHSRADQIILAQSRQTDYRLVVPEHADLSTWAAALDLADVLRQRTGALFPVATDIGTLPMIEHEIILGADNRHVAALGVRFDAIPDDGYEIRTHGRHIIIAGGAGRGTINGIYGFAQDHLGCRWLTPGCQYIPAVSDVKLETIHDRQVPAFRWRSTDSAMQWNANWYIRNRFNESKARVGGPRPSAIMQLEGDIRTATMANSWNPHAFQDIPRSLHADHPDWFAEVNGERKLAKDPVHQAYCLSNKEFANWIARWTRDRVAAQPNIQFISITQADNSQNCECSTCQESYKNVGPSGTSLAFANRVAEELAADYPHVSVITFAYLGTFAPTPIVAHPNVRVIWAPIQADLAYALNDGVVNTEQDYVGQLKTWLANTSQLGIWYYQFDGNTPIPRPGMGALQANLKIFREMGVDQLFIEMNFDPARKEAHDGDGDLAVPGYVNSADYYSRKGDYPTIVFPFGFDHMRGYLIARLLWNPDIDVESEIREFCDVYYGAAGAEIADCVLKIESLDSYDKTLARQFEKYDGVHMDFSTSPRMKGSVLEELSAAFDRAEKAAHMNEVFTQRVRMARMGPDLAILAYDSCDTSLKQQAFKRFFEHAEKIRLSSTLSVPGIGSKSIAELKAHFSSRLR